MMKATDFTPDPQNANRGTKRGVDLLTNSLRKYGAGRSILADRNGRIIAGNKTLQAAIDLGLVDVEVVETDGKRLIVHKRTDLDLEATGAARELAYLDNRVAEVDLDWDTEQILVDLEAGVDLAQMFFDDELSAILDGLADEILADFRPVGEDEQPRLDQLDPIICPHCGKNIRETG